MRMFSAFLLGVVSLSLHAQEPAINAMRSDPQYRAALEKNFRGYEASLSTHCSDVTFDWPHATRDLRGAVSTTSAGAISNGAWVERVPGNACGAARRYQVFFLVKDGKVGMQSLLPGDSVAGPQLVRDTGLSLVGAVKVVKPTGQNCPVDVLDTQLIEPHTDAHQPWVESWLVSSCGQRLHVPIRFTPDAAGTGTGISIDAKRITQSK